MATRRRADARATRRSRARRSQPRAHGARRDAVLAGVATVPRMPARRAMRRCTHRSSGRASSGRRAQEGERAADPRACRAVDGRWRSHRARAPRPRRPVRRSVGAAAGRNQNRDRERARRYSRYNRRRVSRSDSHPPTAAHRCVSRWFAPAACRDGGSGLRRHIARRSRNSQSTGHCCRDRCDTLEVRG